MAKKSKADKPKFPKRIAGVKVLKPLRRTGTGLVRFAGTPLGSALVADLMIAGAARIVRDRNVQAAAANAGAEAKRMGSNLAGVVQSAAAAAAAPILTAAHNARGPKPGAEAAPTPALNEIEERPRNPTAKQKEKEAPAVDPRH
jgi:hypothetical protein